MTRRDRRGFVLLTVLWVMVGITVLGLGVDLVARRAVRTSTNRIAATQAAWTAEGCMARVRAVIDGAMGREQPNIEGPRAAWRMLDRTIAAGSPFLPRACDITANPAGRALDINTADPDMLHRLFAAIDIPPARSDSLVDAILDWRDADTLARPLGAEAPWYRAHFRPVPRNGPFASRRELALVRGLSATPGLDTLLDVEPGRVDLNHAPAPVLAALPGITPEVVGRLLDHRWRGVPITDLLSFGSEVSPQARAALAAHYAELQQLTTAEPDAWVITSRSRAGHPSITAVLELRVERSGTRAAIVRRRSWLE